MTAGICEVKIENGKTGGIVLGDCDCEVKCVDTEVNSKKDSSVEQLVRLKTDVVSEESVNVSVETASTSEIEKASGSENTAVESNDLEAIGTENTVVEVIDLDFGKINNSECSLTPSQATDFESKLSPQRDLKSIDIILQLASLLSTVKETIKDSGLRATEVTVVDRLDSTGSLIQDVDSGLSVFVSEDAKDDTSSPKDDAPQSDNEAEQPLEIEPISDSITNEDKIHDPVGNGDIEVTVVDILDSSGNLIDDAGCEVLDLTDLGETEEARMEDDEPQLSDIVGENCITEEQLKDDFIIKDTEVAESDVTRSVNEAEVPLKTIIITDPITNESAISEVVVDFPDVCDDKQTKSEVKDALVVPVLIFPDTLDIPEINIQFGSFGCDKEDPNKETEPTCGADSNSSVIIIDDLQGRIDDKVMTDIEDNTDTNSKEVHKVENVILHETLCLKNENHCDQLVSNVESQYEIQEPLNQINEIDDEHPKELNSLEENVSKPTDEENKKGKK